jgi:hypothetical protein
MVNGIAEAIRLRAPFPAMATIRTAKPEPTTPPSTAPGLVRAWRAISRMVLLGGAIFAICGLSVAAMVMVLTLRLAPPVVTPRDLADLSAAAGADSKDARLIAETPLMSCTDLRIVSRGLGFVNYDPAVRRRLAFETVVACSAAGRPWRPPAELTAP